MSTSELEELRRWHSARRALAEGVAFLDEGGRVLECDARFVELLGRMLDAPLPAPAQLLGQRLVEYCADEGLGRIRELLEAPLDPQATPRALVPSRGFALRFAATPTRGRVVVVHELQTPAVDEDIAFLREQLGVRDEMLAAQQLLISELMAPCIPVAQTVSVVPFVGPFNYDRVDEVLPRLLDDARARGTRTMVVDLTGVAHSDASTPAALARMLATLGLLGVRMIVTGVGTELALTLADDEELQTLELHATLQEALARQLSASARETR